MSEQSSHSHKILGPVHIWALGVGIVLVGEYMGWNTAILRGGIGAALIGMWIISSMYVSMISMTTEMATLMPEAGGQYTMAKYILGPLGAFNIGLMAVMEYAALEAADALVVGEILQVISPDFQPLPYIILALLVLTYVNYRGGQATFTLNLVITSAAFIAVIILLFSTNFYDPQATLIQMQDLTSGLSYGTLGLLAAMHFSCWFFLGIEGTAMEVDACRSPNRALPVGAFLSIATLLIGGTITWFVCSGLLSSEDVGVSVYPLFDAAKATGKLFAIIALFVGTVLSCLASANGCINDASHAWASLSKDTLLPDYFGKRHPRYGSYYRSIVFLLPIALAFAFTGLLDHVVTFSIFSALLVYLLTSYMMYRFRRMYPLTELKRTYKSPLFPIPAFICAGLVICVFFGMHLTYYVNIIAGALFYLVSSIWFCTRRLKFVDKSHFLRPGVKKWGMPKWL